MRVLLIAHILLHASHVNSKVGLTTEFNFTLSSSHEYSEFCPATSLFNFREDGYFRYPLDLFDPILLQNLKHKLSKSTKIDTKKLKSKLFNCSDGHGKINSPHPRHVCSNYFHSKCPINSNIVDVAFKRSSEWLYNVSSVNQVPILYRLWKVMMNPKETIRIILLGGSASGGTEAEGCYCDPTYDRKCHAFNHTLYRKSHTGFGFSTGVGVTECSWPLHFTRWLKSVSLAKVKIYFMWRGGTDFGFAANVIENDFSKTPFTSNDIIFFDYSMNEVWKYYKLEDLHTRFTELERAIRAVYQASKSRYSADWPIVIITETWPYKIGSDWVEPALSKKLIDYTDAYTRFASYYNIPIFSYRDALWSQYYRTKQHQHIQRALAVTHSHPLFFNHLYYADLFAGIFQRELNRVYDFQLELTSKSINPEEYTDHLLNESNRTLPPPLLKLDDSMMCDHSVPPLLDLRATDYVENDERIASSKRDKQSVIGTYKSTPSDSWKVYSDSKTKYGWIDEFPPNYDIKQPRTLDFLMNDKDDDLFKYSHVIIIQYLRKYKNAGKFDAKLCGFEKYDFQIHGNALWDGSNNQKNWKSNRVSTTEILTMAPYYNDIKTNDCFKLLQKKNIMKEGETKSDIKVLEITHVPVEACLHEHNVKNNEECGAITLAQKVKITSVKVCRQKKNEL